MPQRRLKRNRRGRRNGPSQSWSKTIITNPIYTRTIRFHATSAFASYITARCILNLHGGWRNIAAAEFLLTVSSFRLRKVGLFYLSNGTFGSAAGEISLTSYGEHASEERFTSRGTAFKPAHIEWKPKRTSFANLWYNFQDNIESVLFNCVLPSDGFLDLTYQFTLAEGTDTNAVAATSPAADGYYYAALDNSTVAPALAGLLLRADDLSYIALTGVLSPTETLSRRRKLILDKLDEELVDGVIQEEDQVGKPITRYILERSKKEASST